uniref:Uncharacterized protein n=1 Tax=Solanum tuberosum TaxID=4113 RepID=M1DM28_SOLTU
MAGSLLVTLGWCLGVNGGMVRYPYIAQGLGDIGVLRLMDRFLRCLKMKTWSLSVLDVRELGLIDVLTLRGVVERMNDKFTFGDLRVVPWRGWWYGTISVHCTRYSLMVTSSEGLNEDDSYVGTNDPCGTLYESNVATYEAYVATDDPYGATNESNIVTYEAYVATDDTCCATYESKVAIYEAYVATDDPCGATYESNVATSEAYVVTYDPCDAI